MNRKLGRFLLLVASWQFIVYAMEVRVSDRPDLLRLDPRLGLAFFGMAMHACSDLSHVYPYDYLRSRNRPVCSRNPGAVCDICGRQRRSICLRRAHPEERRSRLSG